MLKELERLVKQARKEVGGRAEPVRKQATQAAARRKKLRGPPERNSPLTWRAARGRDRLARLRRAGRRARRRPRRLRLRRPARRPGAGRGHQSEEALRRGAHGRAAAPGADRIADRCVHEGEPCPGRALAGPRLRAPARPQARAGRRGAAADRRPRRLRAGADRAGGRAVALPQQARVLLRRARRRADARLPRPRPLGPDRRRRGLPARLRARQRGPQRGPRLGAARDRSPPTTGASREGVLRNLVVREGRRTGQIQTRLVTSAGRASRNRRSTCTR